MKPSEAERQIAAILASVEAREGAYVDRVEIQDTEITSMDDPRRQIMREVRIELSRVPGQRWGQIE